MKSLQQLLAVTALAITSAVATITGETQEPLSGFVPIDQVPRTDQLPAAPLLVAAYAFMWVAVMVYVWSIQVRMRRVESDIRALRK